MFSWSRIIQLPSIESLNAVLLRKCAKNLNKLGLHPKAAGACAAVFPSTILAAMCTGFFSLQQWEERPRGHILGIVKGIHGDRDLPWEHFPKERSCFQPPTRTLHSFGICTQEVLQALCSVSVSRLPRMQRLRGQGWKEGKHPSSCISICWEASLASRQGKEPGSMCDTKKIRRKRMKIDGMFYRTETRRMSRNSKHFYCLKKTVT